MQFIKTQIKEIKKGDSILDAEGLELVVLEVNHVGKMTSCTTNYKESGFYRCNNTTRRYRSSSYCTKVVY